METFKLGELFCGPGGIACGALRAKSDDGSFTIEHAWANDYDVKHIVKTSAPNLLKRFIAAMYVDWIFKNLERSRPSAMGSRATASLMLVSTKALKMRSLGNYTGMVLKCLKLINRNGLLRKMYQEYARQGSGDFEIILNDMREAGYKLNVHLYKAEEYGVPQTRHRVIIVGIHKDESVKYRVPDPAVYAKCDVTARTALSNIPENAPDNEVRKLADKVVRRLSYINPGENVWQAEERLGEDFPSELRIHTKTKISQIYRKLDPNKPAYTVTAAGGGGTFMYHWTDRELTNRERARIQTFPDDYEFVGNYSSVRKQIGMAVPCKLSEVVITAVLNSFAGIDYPWIEANLEEDE